MIYKQQRKRLFTMLLLVMALLIPQWTWAQTASQPSVGDGRTSNPYIITKAEELAWFRDEVNSGKYNICAKIADDVEVIDLKDFCHAADASQNIEELSWKPIGNSDHKYYGTFDGNGKTISNLYINASDLNMGFFGYTYECTIKNLIFENASVTNTANYTGILVGVAGYGSSLQNIIISATCQVNGGNTTGGIAGNLDGNASNCENHATVQGTETVGGIIGYYSRTGNSMTACANYGKVTATSQTVGGLVGYFSSGTIQDCANYGDIEGPYRVAGMVGFVSQGKIQNVFSYGSICATKNTQAGMVFSYSSNGTTEGLVAYYSGAKLTVNGQETTAKAFGNNKLSEDNATGFTEAQLRSGVVTYMLQQSASSEAKWGQNLADGGDSHPVIGSEHTVYTGGSLVNCKTSEVISGSFTNNPTSSAIKYQHGETTHHAAAHATCTEAGTKEYWQCQDCQRTYSDSQLTEELTNVTNAEQPALGHANNDDGYCSRCLNYVAVKPTQENGTYQIAKPCHLAWFRDYVNGAVVDEGESLGTTHPSASAMLTADIDLTNYCHAAEEGKELLSWVPIGNNNNSWEGKMDGQGHTISNLYIKTAQNYVGLFGNTEGAPIQDITFDKAYVENVSATDTETDYTGILVGFSLSYITGIKTTEDCTVIGQKDTGGIAGGASINVVNCENLSSVKGTNYVGGIAGNARESIIKYCANYGTVENNGYNTGGIIGYAYAEKIEDCANYGKITSASLNTGGIVGLIYENCSIQNVFSYGDMAARENGLGIIVGDVGGSLTAKGIIAYNKEALLNNSSDNIKTVGSGSLTFEDGKEETDVVKGFTKQQIKSGEVAWLLNGSTSDPAEGSTLAWYQELGEDGDEYPVLTSSGGNTVYNNYYICVDKQVNIYCNTEDNAHEKYAKHEKGTETLLDNGLYSTTCQRCETNFMYIKDFCGIKGNNIVLTVESDGSYTATEHVNISDATAYDSPVDFTAPTLNYTRNYLGNNKWQAVYVPFDTEATDWTDNGITAASINNFHEYELEDGSYETVLEVKKATSGVLEANTPYVMRSSESESKSRTVTINDAKLHKAESKTYYCMSMTRRYDFTGIYEAKNGFNSDKSSSVVYVLGAAGTIGEVSSAATLNPQRWYLAVSDRNSSGAQQTTAQVRSIRIDMIGEGNATGINDVQVTTTQSSDSTGRQGIYDLQGRRLSHEPAHGIYVKNGKKYIK